MACLSLPAWLLGAAAAGVVVVDVVGSPLPPIVIVRTFSLSRAMMCDDSVMNDKRSKDT